MNTAEFGSFSQDGSFRDISVPLTLIINRSTIL